MKQNVTRRNFLGTAGVAALATGLVQGAEGTGKTVKILGVACSPRKGMTTAKAVEAALDAAKGVDARVAVELVDLGGLNIAGYSPKPPQDDFTAILPKLQDPALGGLIIGSPAYFRGMSALCKAFIERCAPLREPKMLLANKPVGVVAVGRSATAGRR
jgi:multimeric flavodoxin WrbA